MADNHCTTGEALKTFLKRTQRVDVDVVGGLVEEKHVALLLQSESQLQAVALTT